MPKRCNTCQGVFAARNADGTDYFHACPPVTAAADVPVTERANKRDENLRRGEFGTGRRIKAIGAGVTDV